MIFITNTKYPNYIIDFLSEEWQRNNLIALTFMFALTDSFNQDSANLNTASVTDCNNFCLDAISWTLPKPNFSLCGDDIGCD